MSTPEFDPFRLDVAALAKFAGQLEGRWALASFDRLSESMVAEALGAKGGSVAWKARGESRAVRGGESKVWLHVEAETEVPLECQRCLQPVEMPIAIERSFLFVRGEDAAAQLDTNSEDDVLALTRALDLRELIEDELLLALPIVPRHEVCPEPLLPAPSGNDEIAEEKPNPFAVLAALKQRKNLN